MSEVGLQSPRVVPLVGQGVAACVAQHMGMRLERELGFDASTFHHTGKAGSGERAAPFGREHERRLGILFALNPPQCARFVAKDWMGAWCALLDPADVQRGRGEVDLIPAQVDQL